MMRRVTAIIFLSIGVALIPVAAQAAENKSQGLFISPLRQTMTLVPGHPVPVTVTVGDLSDKPMKVDLNLKQFSVNDYSYDYKFRPLEYEWIKLPDASVTLQPGQKKQVHMTITAPKDAATGGYYFAVFASTLMTNDRVRSTVQAASLLYTKIDGEDTERSAVIQDARVPLFVTGGETPFRFDVKNTGNVHLQAHFFAQMEGLFGKSAAVGVDHILLPSTIRTISGTVPNPVLPGLYKLTYGYKIDSPTKVVAQSAYVIFIPPWFFVVLIGLFLLGNYLRLRKKRPKSDTV